MRSQSPQENVDAAARLILLGVSLAWGLTWPVQKMALDEMPPFSMRAATCFLGAAVLFSLAFLQGRDVRVRTTIARLHLVVAGCLNVTALAVLTAFAQLTTTTSRVAVLTYTMPIWAAVLAYPILGERLNLVRGFSLLTCVVGLLVLTYPLLGSSDLIGLALALGTAVSWAAGTVYLKWARIDADPIALSAWQVVVALVVAIMGLLLVEGSSHLWPVHARTLFALLFAGVVGSGIAYLLWFEVVRRLPAMTASLGVLSVPVVGTAASVLLLGERLTVPDLIGFLLILVAAACVVLAPTSVVGNQ